MQSDLPSGTVTFLFTDVEGSTRLLHELGAERYAEALDEHRRLIREACARHHGVEVDTQGDAFFVAFATAPGALAAAEEMTEALASGPIKVRVGLHTGTPLLTAEGYVGADVHLAARVAGSGHGGQVVLSSSTAALFEPSNSLLRGASLVDLGDHRLKDIEQAVAILQLGDGRFPPLKTISNTNLPRPASSFVGREQELAEILSRIEGGARLVTLIGPGGTGKTRLAIEAASTLVPEYKAGVFWVGLASLRDPVLVTETISQTLGAKDGLAEHIAERELLLLLDNLEQVVEAAPELSSLLEACPNLTLLVTSRELLRVQGEVEYPVPPLAEPEAVSLFCERSQLGLSEEIAELCARLDSLPLAVELAAARTKVLSPAQILERLSQRLDLFKGGRDSDPRQQTLRATIEWSYDLLPPEEQVLFRRLAVFAGGCTLEAAEEVAGADLDTLQSLVEKSLLRFSNERYWMLETIREYAGERLAESHQTTELMRHHAEWAITLAETAEMRLRGPDQRDWFRRLELDHDNMRGAIAYSQEIGDPELGLRFAAALWRLWRTHDHLAEGTRMYERLLPRSTTAPASLRTRALLGASRLAMDAGDVDRSAALAEEALVAARESRGAREVSAATENLALMLMESDVNRSRELLEDSINQFRALGDPIGTADALNNLANLLLEVGDTASAARAGDEGLALQRRSENALGVAFVLHTLGYVALSEDDLELARVRLEECLTLCRELDNVSGIGDSLEGLGHVAAGRGRHARAVVLWSAGESIRSDVGKEMETIEVSLHERALSTVRSRLGEAAFVEAWLKGSELAPDDAVEYALASID